MQFSNERWISATRVEGTYYEGNGKDTLIHVSTGTACPGVICLNQNGRWKGAQSSTLERSLSSIWLVDQHLERWMYQTEHHATLGSVGVTFRDIGSMAR